MLIIIASVSCVTASTRRAQHASLANVEAVMVAGQWRKRDHELLGVDLDDVKERLLASGERLVHQLNKPGLPAGVRRHVVRRVVHRRLAQRARG